MCVSVYMKGCYEEFNALKAEKNKANSKPIKANQSQSLDICAMGAGTRPSVLGGGAYKLQGPAGTLYLLA